MWLRVSILSGVFLLLSPLCWAKDIFHPESIVHEVVKKHILEEFRHWGNQAPKASNSLEFVERNFPSEAALEAPQRESLKKMKAPKVFTSAQGISFEFESNKGFQIIMNPQWNDFSVQDLSGKKTTQIRHVLPLLFLQNAVAQGWEEAAIVAGGAVLVRQLASKFLVRLVAQVAVGASLGCLANIGLQNDGEQSPGTSCKNGAEEGATLFIGGIGAGKVWQAAKNGKRWAQLVSVLGIGAAVAFTGVTAKELATMNNPILRCNSKSGDFQVSVRLNGVTGRDLYSVDGDNVTFVSGPSTDLTRTEVKFSKTSLTDFFKNKKFFPGSNEKGLDFAADEFRSQVQAYQKECKSHGGGYTRSLWTADDQKWSPPSAPGVKEGGSK